MWPGDGAKSRSGSSALSRASMACPDSAGGGPSSLPPAATWSCSRTRSVPVVISVIGCSTWSRVFTSRKANSLLPGVVEELDGAGAAVAHGHREPPGRRLQLGGLPGREHRRGGLLDDLLVAPLHRAVADAERPRRALAVGDHLDLDVPRARDQALQEDDAAAERAQRLLAGALVGVGEVAGRGDHADAAPAAARGGLEHQGVADLVTGPQRGVEARDLTTAPRRDRDPDLLGDQLRADLVTELAHRLRARPDERDADLLAQLGERRVLGHEAPADPRGVGPGLDQCLLQHGEVEVGAGRGRTQRVGQVGLPDERRGPVRIGVEGDRLDPRPCLRGKIPDGVDQPHRGLPAVDDRDTTEHRLSLPCTHAQQATSEPGASPEPACTLPTPCPPTGIYTNVVHGTRRSRCVVGTGQRALSETTGCGPGCSSSPVLSHSPPSSGRVAWSRRRVGRL